MICLWVWLSHFGHAPSLTSPLDTAEVEALPSHRVVLSRWSSVLWPPPTSHPASPWISLPAYTSGFGSLPTDQVRPPLFHRLLSQHPALRTPEGSSRLLSRFFAASMAFVVVEQLGSLLVPFGLTFRRCKIHFMLRAAALHSLLRRILRFSTSSRPEALGACYVASWQLPRPDSHRLANDDFQGTPASG